LFVFDLIFSDTDKNIHAVQRLHIKDENSHAVQHCVLTDASTHAVQHNHEKDSTCISSSSKIHMNDVYENNELNSTENSNSDVQVTDDFTRAVQHLHFTEENTHKLQHIQAVHENTHELQHIQAVQSNCIASSISNNRDVFHNDILNMEAYTENPNGDYGPYEFLSWKQSLSKIKKSSKFDETTKNPFFAKCIPVYMVGCKNCGPITLTVYDENYCAMSVWTNRWWDSHFMLSFTKLMAHQFHSSTVKLVQCTELELTRSSRVTHSSSGTFSSDTIPLSTGTASVVAFLVCSSHYVVVEYILSDKVFKIYDGLKTEIKQWIPHCYNIQARCGHPYYPPKLSFGECRMQQDSHSCGPLACHKLWHLVSGVSLDPADVLTTEQLRLSIVVTYTQMLDSNSKNILRKWKHNIFSV